MYVTHKYVPEGKFYYATVTVKHRASGEVFPSNVLIANEEVPEGSEDWEYDEDALNQMSEELAMLLRTCVAIAPNVQGILKALNDRGYGLVIEDGDRSLATDLFDDYLSREE